MEGQEVSMIDAVILKAVSARKVIGRLIERLKFLNCRQFTHEMLRRLREHVANWDELQGLAPYNLSDDSGEDKAN